MKDSGKELINKIFDEVLGAFSVDTNIIAKYISSEYIQDVDGNTFDVEFLAIAEDRDIGFRN